MDTIPWSEKFSVGSDRVDRQHRDLLDHANRLFGAIKEEASSRDVEELLGFLQKYVALHFLSEERIMHRLGFPDVEAHRTTHWRIVEQLIEVEKLHAREGASPALVERLTRQIGPDLVNHFMGEDQRLAEFLASQGAEEDAAWP